MSHTILLVDDEYGFLEVLALLMKQEGYDVAVASDGEEALARLQEQRPDLVITDYWMPKMDGLELCRRMHADERWRGIPVLLLTAVHDPGAIPAVPGLTRILRKPVHLPDLMSAAKEALGRTARD